MELEVVPAGAINAAEMFNMFLESSRYFEHVAKVFDVCGLLLVVESSIQRVCV